MTAMLPVPSKHFLMQLLKRKMPLSMAFTSAGMRNSDLPKSQCLEIAIVGRSNVGKSSLINFLAGQKNLARVSRTPGRTQTINLFSVENGKFTFVDLPGYGYAESPREVQHHWKEAMAEFLTERPALFAIVFLLDIRRELNDEDRQLFAWLRSLGHKILIVHTKCDKIAKHLWHSTRLKHAQALGVSAEIIIETSSEKNMGRDALYAGLVGLFEQLKEDERGEAEE